MCIKRLSFQVGPIESYEGAISTSNLPDRDLLWFPSAHRAVNAAYRIVSENPSLLSGGVATGDTTSDECIQHLIEEATGAAGLTQPGQVLVSLSTQEISRFGLDDHLTYIRVGHRELENGLKSMLFLIVERGPDREYFPLATENRWRVEDFVGRAEEIDLISNIFKHSRVVCLHGEAGVGKTALAIRFSLEWPGDKAEQVVHVDLDEVRRPNLMLHRIAPGLGVEFGDESRLLYQIVKAIGEREILLVLDGVDAIADAAAGFVEQVHDACPNASFLLTSRCRLSVRSATLVPVKGLEFPNPFEAPATLLEYDAVRMLLSLGRRLDASFLVDEDGIRDLAYIANAVEGSPLAIKMVASRLGILSTKQILSRLKDDPLGFLVDRSLPNPSMLSVFSAALSTLNPWASLLFRRLWIFEGSFDLEAVEAVCVDEKLPKAAVLDSLKALLETYLIVGGNRGPAKRSFRLSQICREYSRSLTTSNEKRVLIANMSLFLKDKQDRFWPNGLTSEARAVEEFDLCYEDLRASWLRDLDSKSSAIQAVESVAKSSNFFVQKLLFAEGHALARRIADSPNAAKTPRYVSVLNLGAWCAMRTGEYRAAEGLLLNALRIATQNSSSADQAKLLNTASSILHDTCRVRSALRCSRMAARLLRELGDPAASIAESNLASLLVDVGRLDEAEQLLNHQAEARSREDWFSVSYYCNWTHLRAAQGNWPEAIRYLRLASDISQRFPYRDLLPNLHLNACAIAKGQNRLVDLANLVAATHAIVDHFGLELPPRRKQILEDFGRFAGKSEGALREDWNSLTTYGTLDQFLITSN